MTDGVRMRDSKTIKAALLAFIPSVVALVLHYTAVVTLPNEALGATWTAAIMGIAMFLLRLATEKPIVQVLALFLMTPFLFQCGHSFTCKKLSTQMQATEPATIHHDCDGVEVFTGKSAAALDIRVVCLDGQVPGYDSTGRVLCEAVD